MFSLCIPTIDRFESFLNKNIPKYLENELIDEIIISDENGNDINLLKHHYPNNSKLKLFKNDKVLGPFLNKMKACSYAKNDWIALIDSDNYCDYKYFDVAKKYLKKNNDLKTNIILSPCFAKPNFNYECLKNVVLTKQNIKEYSNKFQIFNTFINTGNYILNKKSIQNLNITSEPNDLIYNSSACDVKYMNTLFLEQFEDLEIHVVENMEYEHTVHDNSIYLQTYMKTWNTINTVDKRFIQIC